MSQPEAQAELPPQPVAADDQLPPVEPPSATFILQLFVVPGLIVLAIVLVWLLFSWIAHRASANPEDVIRGLEGSGPARWQRASELADMLRNDRYQEFRQSPEAATKLADILDREITAGTSSGGMDSGAINLRYFLARALGEFEVEEGMDVLLRAATTVREPGEEWVSRGAIQAIAVRAHHHAEDESTESWDDSAVTSTLIELADSESDLIRSETAYTLGRIGSSEAIQQLKIMVDDVHADTRYNAAVALAQFGHIEALPTLAEMLDPAELASVREEVDPPSQVIKRAVIINNALRAVTTLKETLPKADFDEILALLEQIKGLSPEELREARIDPMVQAQASRTLDLLSGSGS